jgi:predicted dehydrogenase
MIRVAIVGCGRIVNAHLHGFRLLRERGVDTFRITALVASREADAWSHHSRGHGPPPLPAVLAPQSGDPLAAPHTYVSDFQDDVEARVFTDWRRLLDAGVADALLDTTPVFLHHEIGLAALDTGLHLLTQKPLAVTVRAAQALVARARTKGRTLGVFENARFRPQVRAVRWAFESGLLGQPQLAMLGALGGPWSPDRVVAATPWRHQKVKAGGGASLDIGVHHMDTVRYVLGEVESVQALVGTLEAERFCRDTTGRVTETVRPDADDTYFAGVRCAGGAIAQLFLSWACRGASLPMPFLPAFYGSRGCVQAGQLILEDGDRQDLLARCERELPAAERERLFPLGLHDSFAINQLDWLRSIAAGRDLETSGEEGLRDLAAAFAILESAAAGRAVTLAEVLNGSADAYQRPIDEYHSLLTAQR